MEYKDFIFETVLIKFMNTDLAGKIDYWVGIPLCFFLSGLNSVFRIMNFLKTKNARPVKKILFIKLSELGAIILSYPLLNRIKEEFVSAELFFVTFYKNNGIFKLLNDIVPEKNILYIREDPFLFILDTVTAILKLRKENIDIVFDLEFFSRFSAIFVYFVKSEKSIGFYNYALEGLYRGSFLTHRIQYNPLKHVVKNYLAFAQSAGESEKNSPQFKGKFEDSKMVFPQYKPVQKIKVRLLEKIKNFNLDQPNIKLFLINPGEGFLSLREWGVDRFVALSKLILKDENNYVVIIGSEGAERKALHMVNAVDNSRCISLVTEIGLAELMELFYISDALISNDCGLAHLATLSPIKKFVIFGPESPQIFGPIGENIWIIFSNWPCSPCFSILNHRKSFCSDNECLKTIKPEDVYALIKKNL